MPYATTDDGVKLFYEEEGEGETLVFVHEFAGDYRSWEPQIRFLAEGTAVSYITPAVIHLPMCPRTARSIPKIAHDWIF